MATPKLKQVSLPFTMQFVIGVVPLADARTVRPYLSGNGRAIVTIGRLGGGEGGSIPWLRSIGGVGEGGDEC